MDRRNFLKALAAIGAAGISARSLANASERTIERAWQKVASEPRIFYVRDEYPYTLTTEPSYNAEIEEMIAAWGDDGAGIPPMDCATGQGRAMTFFYLWEETGNFDIRSRQRRLPGQFLLRRRTVLEHRGGQPDRHRSGIADPLRLAGGLTRH